MQITEPRRSNTTSKQRMVKLRGSARKFNLSTLGLKSDWCLRSFSSKKKTPKMVKRWQHAKSVVSIKTVSDHIESFNRCISYYRREHALNIRYLSSEITLEFLYKDFQLKYLGVKCSKSSYCNIVWKELIISFAALGHEECEQCESFALHKIESGHTVSQEVIEQEDTLDCKLCEAWKNHKFLVIPFRKLYQQYASLIWDKESEVCRSVEMQIVKMLPWVHQFNQILFVTRPVTLDESFFLVSNKSKWSDIRAQKGRYPKHLLCFGVSVPINKNT